jgi:hypothetical protein
VRRIAVIALVLVAACSSGGSTASSAADGSSASGATTSDPATLSSADVEGTKSFLSLYAAQLQKLDPTITEVQVDCIPDTVLTVIAPSELSALIDSGLTSLPPDAGTALRGALATCGLTATQISKADLG